MVAGIMGGTGLLLSPPSPLSLSLSGWEGGGDPNTPPPPLFFLGEHKGAGKGKTKKYQTPILPALQICKQPGGPFSFSSLPSFFSFHYENKIII